MNIEFHEKPGLVKPWIINHLRDELVRLHHVYPELARAQVYFKTSETPSEESVCEIDVPVYGASIYIHRAASGFEQVTRDVISELERIINDRNVHKNDPPDSVTSSIEVEEGTDLS